MPVVDGVKYTLECKREYCTYLLKIIYVRCPYFNNVHAAGADMDLAVTVKLGCRIKKGPRLINMDIIRVLGLGGRSEKSPRQKCDAH